jgi:hypothetical protein
MYSRNGTPVWTRCDGLAMDRERESLARRAAMTR